MWDFAQKYSGNLMLNLGIITLIISIIVSAISIYINQYEMISIILTSVQVVMLILVIPFTEHKLKKMEEAEK